MSQHPSRGLCCMVEKIKTFSSTKTSGTYQSRLVGDVFSVVWESRQPAREMLGTTARFCGLRKLDKSCVPRTSWRSHHKRQLERDKHTPCIPRRFLLNNDMLQVASTVYRCWWLNSCTLTGLWTVTYLRLWATAA